MDDYRLMPTNSFNSNAQTGQNEPPPSYEVATYNFIREPPPSYEEATSIVSLRLEERRSCLKKRTTKICCCVICFVAVPLVFAVVGIGLYLTILHRNINLP